MTQNSAEAVVAKFGGQTAVARLIGKGQSTVGHWVSVGRVPAKWQPELLRLAGERGIDLTPSDFMSEPIAAAEIVHDPAVPVARWFGMLEIGNEEVGCYVLDDGRRVISRTGATDALTGGRGGGNLESYLRVEGLNRFLPDDLPGQMIEFTLEQVRNKRVRGIEAETFLDICKAYGVARDAGALTTERQLVIAIRAGAFVAACSKLGLISLIDEATGYQYARAADALQFKLKLYLADEMRKWEKTFPDELWAEFGRLTHWKGTANRRPKYWGRLVTDLVYTYLDPDVAEWLKRNVPKPQGHQTFHQWLNSQYGLRKLTEHLWMLIGMAAACQSMPELKDRMAERFGHKPYQYTLYLPPPPKAV